MSQCKHDSLNLKCFTLQQTKVFLLTKIELDNCLVEYNGVLVENHELRSTNTELEKDLTTTEKKLKRNRWLAGGGISSFFVLLGIVISVK